MDRLLSVSQAARMAGVPRKMLQQHIQEGRVATFEGYIRMSELHKAYPEVSGDRSGMLEKTRRIRDAAVRKDLSGRQADPERMATELHRAELEIQRLQEKVASYRKLAAEAEGRLRDVQDHCDRRQASMLGAFLGWYMNQNKLRS